MRKSSVKHASGIVFFFLVIGLLSSSFSFGQTSKDSLVMISGDLILGKIKSLEYGVLKISVPYSKKNLEVNWQEIKKISTSEELLITLEKGVRLRGIIYAATPDSVWLYIDESSKSHLKEAINFSDSLRFGKTEILEIRELKEAVLEQLTGQVSVGINLAKSNRLRQFSLRSSLNYNTNWFGAGLTFNGIRSTQEATNSIQRYDGGITLYSLLRNDWYGITRINFLNNTEQLIALRTDFKLGFGKYLIRKYKLDWSLQAGLNLNNERFYSDFPSKQSTEFVIGSAVDILNIGNFAFKGIFLGYAGLKEKGRIRSDSKLDISYEFLDDFFIKIGATMNYDNKAVKEAPNFDYIIQSTIGWKF